MADKPDYPASLPPVNHVEPVPRRVRAALDDRTVLDTTRALYVWEWPHYPQYYIPLDDVAPGVLAGDGEPLQTRRGPVRVHDIGGHPQAAKVHLDAPDARLNGTVRIEWAALDHWYEEDEEVFVHPRDPYTRVDALRSTRHVRVELEGAVLAESRSPVLVFETGLPTRYYLNRTEVRFEHLTPSPTVTACPYKGTTSAYWSVNVNGTSHPDLAWSYAFPTRQLLPIAGLVAFYNEKVDLWVEGELLARPSTPFS